MTRNLRALRTNVRARGVTQSGTPWIEHSKPLWSPVSCLGRQRRALSVETTRRHGQGPSPRRGLRRFPGVGKRLVRAACAGGRSGAARAERAPARLVSASRIERCVLREEARLGSRIHRRCCAHLARCEAACETRLDARRVLVRARAGTARALRGALTVSRARLRRTRRPALPIGSTTARRLPCASATTHANPVVAIGVS